MQKHFPFFIMIVVLFLLLAACGAPTQAPTPTDTAVIDGEMIVEEEEQGPAPMIDVMDIYTARCARCHGADRSGNNGPPLLPEYLSQDPSVYKSTITNGSGPMPAFGNRLSGDEISALVEYILSDPQ